MQIGLNFRSTAVFVTDPANCAPVLGEAYPHVYTNANSVSVTSGWLAGLTIAMANRSAAGDARLAGINYQPSGNSGSPNFKKTLQVDLPATGSWSITLACGDQSSSQSQYIKLMDGGVVFATYSAVATAANSFMDANGTVFTAANWPANNTKLTHVFTSTTFTIQIGPDVATGSGSTTIAHLFLEGPPITYVPGSGNGGGSAGSSMTFASYSMTAGQIFVALGEANAPNLTLSLTCPNFTAITNLGTWNDATNAATIAMFVARVATSGTPTVTMTASGGSPVATGMVGALYSGCNAGSPYESWANGTFSVASGVLAFSPNLTVGRTDDYIICLFGGLSTGSDGAWGTSSGFTMRGHTIGSSPSIGLSIIDKASGGAGTFSGGTSTTAAWQGQAGTIALQTASTTTTAAHSLSSLGAGI